MIIAGFDWDAANVEKCQKHGVLIEEIEGLFESQPVLLSDSVHTGTEDRFIAVGTPDSGRHVFVAFTFRARRQRIWIRPISARYMHEKEVRRYEKAVTKVQD
ncbi:MAG: BrnT family toxin [Acidobacteria bacterium]|nr:BrnT family toxin [Acidobacteriota bacterium]